MVATAATSGPPSIPSLPFLLTNATKFVSYANFGKQVTTNKNNKVAIFSNGSLVTSITGETGSYVSLNVLKRKGKE